MFTLDVRADFGPAIRQLNALKQGIGDKVIVATLNETITQARTQVIKGITEVYKLKASDIRDKLAIARASRKGQHFQATLYGKRAGDKWSLNIARFITSKGEKRRAARATRLAKAYGGTASYALQAEVRKGSIKAVPGAFVLNVAGQPVVHREGGRLRGVQTVGVPQMFARPSVQKPILRWLPGKFAEIFDRRMRYFVSTIK